MNKDIRIAISFKNHRKKKKLQHLLGAEGVLSLINLWLSVAENRPNGKLVGYTETDIEIDAEWSGEPGSFAKAISDIGFLDVSDCGEYSMHNWEDRQEWVYSSETRSDRARFSRLARVLPDEYERLKKEGVRAISKEKYKKLTDIKTDEPLTTVVRDVNEPLTTVVRDVNEPLTTVVRDVNEPLTTVVRDVNEPLTDRTTPAPTPTPAPAPVPVPVPVPSPTHNVIRRSTEPDKSGSLSAGSFKKKNNDHFQKYFSLINTACKCIESMEPGRGLRMLNPYQWVQQQINEKKHPGAIDECLRLLTKNWGGVQKGYYSYLNGLMENKNPIHWENQDILKAENYKQMLSEAVDSGILEELGINFKTLKKK